MRNVTAAFRRRMWLTAALAWSVLILIACLLPGSLIPEPEELGISLFLPHPDRWVHYVIFLVWGILWRLVWRGRWDWVAILLAGALYGALTEVLQHYGGLGRTGDLTDWVADLAGIVLGLFLARWIVPWVETGEVRRRNHDAIISTQDPGHNK